MPPDDPRTEKQKMLDGALYRAVGAEIEADAHRAAAHLKSYNATAADDGDTRREILASLCGTLGDNVVIRPPFHCDYGFNLHIGRDVFVNFGCVFLDVVPIHIGAFCQFGPGVQLLTADHPRDPALRREGYESGRPIRVGANVWIGGGALVLPGVTIGDDAIIGAGSVVTRDVAPGATVMGNPARPRPSGPAG